jgi:hypothetical protein
MKAKKVFFVFAVLAALTGWHSKLFSQTLKQVLYQRAEIAGYWINCAQAVATLTKDEEAQKIVDFLKNNSTVVNLDSSCSFGGYIKKSRFILIFPVLSYSYCSIEDKFRQMPECGHFDPRNNLLVICGDKLINRFFIGMTLLHEGNHAYARHVLGMLQSANTRETLCKEEIRVYNFTRKLYNSVTNGQYDSLLEARSVEIGKIIDPKTGGLKYTHNIGNYAPALYQMFNCQTDDEKKLIVGDFLVDSLFYYVDKTYNSEKSETVKIEIYKKVAKNVNEK